MALANFFNFRSVVDCTAEMAERVAGRSRMAVWQRVKDGLAELGPIEIRGYLRARSLPVVKEETGRLIEQEGAKVARRREAIVEAATESLIRTIIAQCESRRNSNVVRRAA